MSNNRLPPLRRILIVRLDNIGDIVMLGPSLRALRKSFPDAHVTLMCSPAGSQVAPMLPWINDVMVWTAVWQDTSENSFPNPQKEANLIDQLRLGSYDAAIIFTSFTQSPYPPAYCAYLAGIPLRAGQSKEFGGSLLTHWFKPLPDPTHQVDRNLSLLSHLGIPDDGRNMELSLSDDAYNRAQRLLKATGIDPSTPYMVVVPGASCTARRYPAIRYREVVQQLSEKIEHPILVLGDPRENNHLAPYFHDSLTESKVVSLIGKTSIEEFIAIVSRSRLIVANNSAALHIGDAFKRPMVILYSGTEYIEQWEPRFAPVRILNREVKCSPCYRFECPYKLECLHIHPFDVAASVVELYEETQDIIDNRIEQPIAMK